LQEPKTPPIPLPNGGSFQPAGAWSDVYEAVCNAKHLIYITGWSVYDKITLVREPDKPMFPSAVPTLGEAQRPSFRPVWHLFTDSQSKCREGHMY
jgi:phospholipase D1/2